MVSRAFKYMFEFRGKKKKKTNTDGEENQLSR